MPGLLDDLRQQIASCRVIAIIGAGVSIGATGADTASWPGLLKDGIKRCEEVGAPRPTPGWSERQRGALDDGQLDELLSVASQIESRLGAPNGGEYRRWLRESVGALRANDRAVLEAVRDLGVPFATTNYDGLIEEVTGLRLGVTESEFKGIRGDEPGVLHLHGHWEQPETVVLGIRSYDKVLGDAHAQTVQSALGLMKSFLFVGCGAGLVDPNLGALLQWIRKVLAGSEYRHFRLCRDAEIDEVQKLHPPEERIFPVRYGATHADLASFLRRLSPPLFRPATSSFRQSATWRIERPRGGDPGATLYDQEIETAHETPAQTTLDSTSHRKNSKTSVFISYCHRDNRWRQRLDIHLKPIVESGLIASWHDGLIDPGRKWREEKQLAIETAKIAILLVSADFLASDFIRRNELPPLLKAAESRGCRILPIIVRPCRFSRTPEISQFQAFNPPERPLSAMNANERESLFARVADIIENIFWTRCIADVIDHVVHAGFEINDRPDRNVFQIQGVAC